MTFKPRTRLLSALTGLLVVGGVITWQVLDRPSVANIIPGPAGSTRIVAVGDIACPPGALVTKITCRQADTAELTKSLKPAAVLLLGDLQYPDGKLSDFKGSFDKSWGRFLNITKPVPGNHEYESGGEGYFDYFGDLAGERGKGYYSFNLGGWHIVALNSEIDASADSQQRQWLREDLKADTSLCTMAFWHKPFFSTGPYKNEPKVGGFWTDLYRDGADVVLNGHSHGYERFTPVNTSVEPDERRGIVTFISGMGGRAPEPQRATRPELIIRQNHSFGVLKLDLSPGGLSYQFVTVPGEKSFIDHGSLACHK